MAKTLFEKYWELDGQIKKFEEEKELLRDMIVVEMRDADTKKQSTDFGIFTRAAKTNWKYTDKVTQLEEKVKVAKVKEQQSGKAQASLTEYLKFTPL
jgi:hypothetical protein